MLQPVILQEVCVSLFLRDKAARVRNATFAPLIAVSHLRDELLLLLWLHAQVLELCQQVSSLSVSLNVPDMVKKCVTPLVFMHNSWHHYMQVLSSS